MKTLALKALAGASFGDFAPGDQAYRYSLFRRWDDKRPTLAFCMLNPSTADHVNNDPTVERCERRARMLGFGKLIVVNLFALRSTDPNKLYSHADPCGSANDEAILCAAQESRYMVCAWGEHGALNGRGRAVRALLHKEFKHHDNLCHLGINASGEPKHPLYIGYKVPLQKF